VITHLSHYVALLQVSVVLSQASVPSQVASRLLTVHNITRFADNTEPENLAIRPNGQILATTTYPNASIYRIDPLGILPPALIHLNPNATTATVIAEVRRDILRRLRDHQHH